jgi:hypothetical protein
LTDPMVKWLSDTVRFLSADIVTSPAPPHCYSMSRNTLSMQNNSYPLSALNQLRVCAGRKLAPLRQVR